MRPQLFTELSQESVLLLYFAFSSSNSVPVRRRARASGDIPAVIFLNFTIEVEFELVIEFTVGFIPAEERTEAKRNFGYASHL
jgi:hypothetical protein